MSVGTACLRCPVSASASPPPTVASLILDPEADVGRHRVARWEGPHCGHRTTDPAAISADGLFGKAALKRLTAADRPLWAGR